MAARQQHCSSSGALRARRRRWLLLSGGGGAPNALLPILLLLLIGAPRGSYGMLPHISSRARAQLAEFVSTLPLAGDALDAMNTQQRAAWAADLGLTAGGTLAALEAPTVTVSVDVKLVGFDGDGAGGARVADHELQAALRALAGGPLETVALRPRPERLLVSPNLEFRVHPAYYTVAAAVSDALASELRAARESRAFTPMYPLTLVDPAGVAAALRADWAATARGSGTAFTLYLVNPKAGAGATYAYSYDGLLPGSGGGSGSSGGSGGSGSNQEPRACPGGVYLSRGERWAFFDVGANVTFAGPGLGGQGQLLPHAVPSLKRYRPEVAARAIVPELAALAESAARHLAWPPLYHAHLEYAPAVAVRIVYLHQDLMGAAAHVDRAAIEEELRDALKGVQSVTVTEHWVSFGDCAQCVAGYSSALRARAMLPEEHREGAGGAAGASVTQYLDADALAAWAHEWRDVVLGSAGVETRPHGHGHGGGAATKTLPVFVFDAAAKEPVLIDGWRQAIALPSGDVVAAVGGGHSVPTFFGCHDAQVRADPRAATRPVLAALLRAGWGVEDPSLAWSPAAGPVWSHLWSLGRTPFGPLASSPSLSFAQRDAMVRNLALAAINGSVGHAQALLRGVVKVAGGSPDATVRAFIAGDQVTAYHTRIAMLLTKHAAAAAALSRLDHAAALGYALSMAHDAATLHAVFRRSRAAVAPELQCHGGRERARWWLVPAGAAAACVALIAWRTVSGARAAAARDKMHTF